MAQRVTFLSIARRAVVPPIAWGGGGAVLMLGATKGLAAAGLVHSAVFVGGAGSLVVGASLGAAGLAHGACAAAEFALVESRIASDAVVSALEQSLAQTEKLTSPATANIDSKLLEAIQRGWSPHSLNVGAFVEGNTPAMFAARQLLVRVHHLPSPHAVLLSGSSALRRAPSRRAGTLC